MLFGETHDDILVAGATIHDEEEEALQAILAEWISSRNYTTRVRKLRTGGGANGVFVLDDATVIHDSAADTLWGGSGLDWILFSLGDNSKDRTRGELLQ
jgi:hypothetical protein